MGWKTLPHEGTLLKMLEVWGTGKDGGCILTAQGHNQPLRFEADVSALEIHIDGKVATRVVPLADATLCVRFSPLEPLRLTRCRVDFAGTDEEWAKALGRIDTWPHPFFSGIQAAQFHLETAS